MLKTVTYVFIALLFTFLILFAPLFTGIKIDKLSYDNLIFNGLYLKYDKSLIVSVDKFSIIDDKNNEISSMGFDLKIENFFDGFYIEVKKYILNEPRLEFSGKIFLEDYDRENFDYAKFYINDFEFQWDKDLDYLKAPRAWIEYKNKSFYLNFQKPKYVDFDVEGTYASITDIIDNPMLNMYFFSKDNLKKSLIDLIKHYGVDLPIVQEYGNNNSYTKVIVPLDSRICKVKTTEVFFDVDLKDAKLYLFEKPLYVKNINVVFKDNIAKIKGIVNKQTYETEKYKLAYDGFIDLDLDFNSYTGDGNFAFNDIMYRRIDFDKIDGKVKADFKDKLTLDFLFNDNIQLYLDDKKIYLDRAVSEYKEEKVQTSFYAHSEDIPLKIKIKDSFDFLGTYSKGEAEISYKDKDFSFDLENLKYKIIYSDDLDILFELENEILKYKNNTFNISKLKGDMFQDLLRIKSDMGFSFEQNKIDILNLDLRSHIKKGYTEFDIERLIHKSFLFENIKGNYEHNTVSFLGGLNIPKIDLKSDLQSYIDLEKKKINGELFLKSFLNKTYSSSLDYDINYKDEISFKIPALGFLYKQKDKLHKIFVDDIDEFFILQDYLKSQNNKNGSLVLSSGDLKRFNIFMNNCSLDLGLFSKKNDKNDPSEDKTAIDLFSKNGALKYGGYTFNYDDLVVNSDDSVIEAKLRKGKTIVELNKNKEDIFTLHSKYIQNSYLNSIISKELLDEGFSTFVIKGKDDIYKGNLDLDKTKIKNLPALNSLILFINTTPAFINPFLSIPSIYRFTQTGFNIEGYDLEKGSINFKYDRSKNLLFVDNFFFDGTMNDFNGNLQIDLNDKAVNGDIEVIFMKDYAKFINMIPGVKEINSNENIQFSKSINVSGTLDNPKFNPLK